MFEGMRKVLEALRLRHAILLPIAGASIWAANWVFGFSGLLLILLVWLVVTLIKGGYGSKTFQVAGKVVSHGWTLAVTFTTAVPIMLLLGHVFNGSVTGVVVGLFVNGLLALTIGSLFAQSKNQTGWKVMTVVLCCVYLGLAGIAYLPKAFLSPTVYAKWSAQTNKVYDALANRSTAQMMGWERALARDEAHSLHDAGRREEMNLAFMYRGKLYRFFDGDFCKVNADDDLEVWVNINDEIKHHPAVMLYDVLKSKTFYGQVYYEAICADQPSIRGYIRKYVVDLYREAKALDRLVPLDYTPPPSSSEVGGGTGGTPASGVPLGTSATPSGAVHPMNPQYQTLAVKEGLWTVFDVSVTPLIETLWFGPYDSKEEGAMTMVKVGGGKTVTVHPFKTPDGKWIVQVTFPAKKGDHGVYKAWVSWRPGALKKGTVSKDVTVFRIKPY